MNGPRGVHHLAITVRDLARAERFYCDVLGLGVVKRWPAPDGKSERSIWVDTGDGDGTFLALELVASGGAALPEAAGEPPERPGFHLLALRIAAGERATWQERLAAAGVPVYHQTPFTLYVRDPEGNRVGLSSYPDGADSGEAAG